MSEDNNVVGDSKLSLYEEMHLGFLQSISKTNTEKITKEILEGLSEDTGDSDSYDADSAALSSEDIKDPSAEASMVGGKFFTDIWDNGGREMAQEIIQKSEKGIHDARKVAEAAEKSTEPEGQIGIN